MNQNDNYMKPNDEIKRQAMSAVASAQTVAHVGMVKMTGGIALYAAHMKQMDRPAPSGPRRLPQDVAVRDLYE